MRHFRLLLSVLLLTSLATFARERSFDEARMIAERHAARLGIKLDDQSVERARRISARAEQRGKVYYYIFPNRQGQGFTIVSGDDQMPDIVGYADKGNFDEDNLPESLLGFIEQYRATAEAVERGESLAVANVNEAKRLRESRRTSAVSPLLGEIAWNQSKPYNNMCPLYNGTDHAVTGCVATAMAQVMAYWKHPKKLLADIPAYTSQWMGRYISVDGVSAGEEYDWDNMLPFYGYNESSYTQQQADAVAKLMLHCGTAVKMGYGEMSGAHLTPTPLAKYFGYDADLMQEVNRYAFTLQEWISLIDRELQNKRPILYSGSSSDGGHQYVCDGADNNGLYHINWGWGGSANGYFDISILNPAKGGIGSGNAPDGYNRNCAMIIGMQPDNGIKDSPLVDQIPIVISNWGPENGYNKIEITNGNRTNASQNFTVHMKTLVTNPLPTNFKGYVTVGLKKANGTFEPLVNSSLYNLDGATSEGKTYSLLSDVNISYAFPVGKTTLYYIYSTDNKQTWHNCAYSLLRPVTVEATETTLTWSKDDITATIEPNDDIVAGMSNTFNVTFTNNLDIETQGYIDVFANNDQQKPTTATTSIFAAIPAKSSITRQFELTPSGSGDLFVWLTEAYTNNNLIDAYPFVLGEQSDPILSIVSVTSNATPDLYETENAYYFKYKVKGPKAIADEAVFTYGIKNDGGTTYIKYDVVACNAEDGSYRPNFETVKIPGNGAITYLSQSFSPEEIGSRSMYSAFYVYDNGYQELPTNLPEWKLETVGSSSHFNMKPTRLFVYVAGADAPIGSGVTANLSADEKLVEGKEGHLSINFTNASNREYNGTIDVYTSSTNTKPNTPTSNFSVKIAGGSTFTGQITVTPEKKGDFYVWVMDRNEGKELVTAQKFEVAEAPKAILSAELTTYSELVADNDGFLKLTVTNKGNLDYKGVVDCFVSNTAEKSSEPVNNYELTVPAGKTIELKLAVGILKVGDMYVWVTTHNEGEELITAQKFEVAEAPKAILSAELTTYSELVAGNDGFLKLTVTNKGNLDYKGVVDCFVSNNAEKSSEPVNNYELTVPAGKTIELKLAVGILKVGDMYVWVTTHNEGEELITAQKFEVAEAPKAILSAELTTYSELVAGNDGFLKLTVTNKGNLDYKGVVDCFVSNNAEKSSEPVNNYELTVPAGKTVELKLAVGTLKVGDMYVWVTTHNEGEELITAQKFGVAEAPKAILSAELKTYSIIAGEDGILKLAITNKGNLEYHGYIDCYISRNAEKSSYPFNSHEITLPAGETIELNLTVGTQQAGDMYLWVTTRNEGEELINAQKFEVAEAPKAILSAELTTYSELVAGNDGFLKLTVTNKGNLDYEGSIDYFISNNAVKETTPTGNCNISVAAGKTVEVKIAVGTLKVGDMYVWVTTRNEGEELINAQKFEVAEAPKAILSAELTTYSELVAGEDGYLKLTVTNKGNLDYNGIIDCYVSDSDLKSSYPFNCHNIYVAAGETVELKLAVGTLQAGDMYLWVTTRNEGEELINAQKFEVAEAPKAILNAELTTLEKLVEGEDGVLKLTITNHGDLDYEGIIDYYISENNEKCSDPFDYCNVSVPAGETVELTLNVGTLKPGNLYVWVTTRNEGEELINAQMFEVEKVHKPQPIYTIVSATCNITPDVFETENAVYGYMSTEGPVLTKVKAPVVVDDEVVFTYGIRNDGETAVLCYEIIGENCETLSYYPKFVEAEIEGGGAITYLSETLTPEQVGSRCIMGYFYSFDKETNTFFDIPTTLTSWELPYADGTDYFNMRPLSQYTYVAGKNYVAIDDKYTSSPAFVRGGKGEILVKTTEASNVSVYGINGSKVAFVKTEAGVVEHIRLSAGVYVVNGKKVVVR